MKSIFHHFWRALKQIKQLFWKVRFLLKLSIKSHRSSHRRCSLRKGVLRNFTKFIGKRLCQSLFFNKVAGIRPTTLLKKRLSHMCFPLNFVKFLRTPFTQNTSGRLLLNLLKLNIGYFWFVDLLTQSVQVTLFHWVAIVKFYN